MTLRGSGHFLPLGFELFGTLGESTTSLLRRCARHAASGHAPDAFAEDVSDGLYHYYCSVVGVALQQGLAHSLRAYAAHVHRDFALRRDEAQAVAAHSGPPLDAMSLTDLSFAAVPHDW
jgi:hypothetical protein